MKTITIAPLRVSPRSTSIRTLASLLGVSALCLVCNPVNASFEEGKRQFERGNYSQALEAFQAERRARPNDPAVLYNLATTQFRLGQLGEAKRVYAELAENPEWSDVAHYNLGLVALQQGDTEQAQADFRYVIDQSSSAELRSLASQRLTAAVLDTRKIAIGGSVGWRGSGSIATTTRRISQMSKRWPRRKPKIVMPMHYCTFRGIPWVHPKAEPRPMRTTMGGNMTNLRV